MGVFGFVIALLVSAAALMAARFLVPHVIDGVAVYSALILASIAFCGAVIGVVKG